jgi:AcrR family transcriptional regulator/DNA-binding MarR family transcriptional regulator
VSEHQRGRILSAAAEIVAEMGYARMSVAQVIGRARVSRKTFYELFGGREECFLAVFSDAVARAGESVGHEFAAAPDWPRAVRAGLARVLELVDEEPALARLCLVEALGAGERVLARRARVLEQAATAIHRGRELAPPGCAPPPLAAEAAAGAVFSVLHTRILAGGPESASQLLGPLTAVIVLPYLGVRAAAREQMLPPAANSASASSARAAREPRADPLEGLQTRLTYRTLRVLSAIAEQPGASNRAIAARSGISDQGQVSKLLSRLAGLELLVNRGAGQRRGAPNAWHLTARGRRLELAIRPR